MSTNKVFTKYARALCNAVEEKNVLDETEKKIVSLKNLFSTNKQAEVVLKDPCLTVESKEAFFADLLSQDEDKYVRNFMQLLCRKHREAMFDDIAGEFIKLANAARGILTVKVTTTETLPDEEYIALGRKIKELSGASQVRLEMAEDKTLIGGIVVNVDDVLLDGSIKRRINDMRLAIS